MLKLVPFKIKRIHLPGMCQICGGTSQVLVSYLFIKLELCEKCRKKIEGKNVNTT